MKHLKTFESFINEKKLISDVVKPEINTTHPAYKEEWEGGTPRHIGNVIHYLKIGNDVYNSNGVKKTIFDYDGDDLIFQDGTRDYFTHWHPKKPITIKEGIASTKHISVGEEYSYNVRIQGKPPVKIKVEKIVNDVYFIGSILEENESTNYLGWKKGENYQLDTANIIEISNKEINPENKIIEPKIEKGIDMKLPHAKEAFDKVVNWAKENKLRTVAQSLEYGVNDIYIALWDNSIGGKISAKLDVIVNVSNKQKVKELLNSIGKVIENHMDEHTKGVRYVISIN